NYPVSFEEQFHTRYSPRYERDKDLMKFQSSVNEWYERQISFLNKYAKENQLSEQFVKAQKNDIFSEKQYHLLTPLIHHGFTKEDLSPEYLADMHPVNINEIQNYDSWYVMMRLLFQDVIAYQEGEGKLLGNYLVENPSQKEVLALTNLISYHSSSSKGSNYQQLKD